MDGASLTRRSSRERVQTPKASEWNKRRPRAMSSDVEDTIEVIETVPAAPQSKRTEINAHLKERIVATKVKALTAKSGERPATMAATLNRSALEKAVPTANTQIKVLTDLVKSLLEAMEGQTSAMEELRKEHANQIEVLTRTFSQQIETLKAQVTVMTEKIETQLSNTQPPLSASPSYAEVARTLPSSGPSNVRTLTSMGTTPSTMTDILYCTIDTSRVGEEDRSKAQPGAIRRAIEEEIRTMEGQEHWRCVAVSKDARNYDRIRVTCRDETELQRVKKAAEKTAVMGVRVLRDQLYPVKVDNANRTAILDQDGKVLPGATEALGKENDVHIAKIAWLSRKDIGKAYGSMVVYVTKGSDAARLLQGQYFHMAGESAYTRVFEPRSVPGVPKRGTITANAERQYRNACLAADPTSHSARIVKCSILLVMNRSLTMLQLNVRKQQMVQHSLMNDERLKEFAVLAISEPYVRTIDNNVITVPMKHSNWTKMVPTVQREERWAFRSMLWIRKDIEAEQVAVQSSDITAAVLRLPDRSILVVSVYVEGPGTDALLCATNKLHQVIQEARNKVGTRVDVILAGDFNRHDQLWGGDEVSQNRQGEADAIVDLMSEYALHSLLPRGTKTWQSCDRESTIDLILASEELATSMVKCVIHATEHGSDHRAIETTFDVATPERVVEGRLLFKNAPWKDIRARIDSSLRSAPFGGSVQQQTDRLMTAVLEAVHAFTPKAKPSPYATRWWTTDLTQLRRVYTYWRSRARTERRAGRIIPDLERQAQAAAAQYHETLRKQKKIHWDDFLADNANIWQAAKYLNPDGSAAFDKIPPLVRTDGTSTTDKTEQARELLATFFPPLPAVIEEEGPRPQRAPVPMPCLSVEEVERRVFAAQSWKAPGDDGLPAIVWKQIWPVVKERVTILFQTSLDVGELPVQWRDAKIIPLKKPKKGNYTVAKAWRPISLLSTLGKALESVVAERISYVVETFGLLPANHFGARKKRSTEQALILLQESIYKAWRAKKVLSLVSFDVKGAYNGVCKERLLQRLTARGIPPELVKWIDAFCSDRTATILVNGHVSERQLLSQAGLPQGSPLSPVLFLFFNADLVQRRIDSSGGSMAFVDDYTAWVTGSTAEANREGIQAIVDEALDWEKRSGATFEGEKTTLVHFTRCPNRSSTTPITIKGEVVTPKETAKILGVTMDSKLRYKQHIASAATKGLLAAMALKRLRMVSPSTARQLFESTVAPVVDYASNIWMHACGTAGMASLNRVQRVGAQAIIGSFRTVAVAVAETEASIRTVRERHADRATKLWVGLHTLPKTNPLSRISTRVLRRFISPLQKIGQAHEDIPIDTVETIQEYAISPWEPRVPAIINPDSERAAEVANCISGICIATSSSERKGMVGMGGAIFDTYSRMPNGQPITFAITLGPRSEQNPYVAELEAIAMAIQGVPPYLLRREITIVTSNQAALQVLSTQQKQRGKSATRFLMGWENT